MRNPSAAAKKKEKEDAVHFLKNKIQKSGRNSAKIQRDAKINAPKVRKGPQKATCCQVLQRCCAASWRQRVKIQLVVSEKKLRLWKGGLWGGPDCRNSSRLFFFFFFPSQSLSLPLACGWSRKRGASETEREKKKREREIDRERQCV